MPHLVYRTSGVVVLALGVALTYSLVFTPFRVELSSWTPTEDGGLERAAVVCPAPWGIVLGDAEDEVRPAWQGRRCVPSANLLFLEGVVVMALALGLGLWGISRGPGTTRPMSALPSRGGGEGPPE